MTVVSRTLELLDAGKKMLLRQEKEAEFPAIYELVKTAFQTAKVSNGDEQNFVERLRGGDGYVPELALVAEDEGKLAGHVMLTKTFIKTDDGPFELLLLAPLAVALERRRQGIGARLIDDVFRRAKEMGYLAIVLVGDPDYYRRFGFRPSADFGIANGNGIPDQYVMACELVPGSLHKANGVIEFQT